LLFFFVEARTNRVSLFPLFSNPPNNMEQVHTTESYGACIGFHCIHLICQRQAKKGHTHTHTHNYPHIHTYTRPWQYENNFDVCSSAFVLWTFVCSGWWVFIVVIAFFLLCECRRKNLY
jgi:hypothetical protein